jgi:hypothetical protein
MCGNFLSFSGTAAKGSTTAVLTARVSSNPLSEKCQLSNLQISPPTTTDKQVVILPTDVQLKKAVNFEIVGPPRVAETMPGSISGEVVLPERQFFRSRAAQVRDQRDLLVAFLDQHAGESANLDLRLLDALKLARQSLKTTQQDFIERYRSNHNGPEFFEDLDRRYQALIVDISAHKNVLAAVSESAPRMIRVQALKPRPNNTSPKSEGLPRLSGTLPPDAYESLDLIDWNIDVYEKIADSGQETFSVALVTLPSDATVEVKRIGEDYVMLGSRTVIPKVTFPFAIWTFRFTKKNCKPHIQRYDPMRDTSPSISVDLVCSR